MPLIVTAAFSNRLKPSIALVRCLMRRWSCSMMLLRYLLDRTRTRCGSLPSDLSSCTARCEAAQASSVIARGVPTLFSAFRKKCFGRVHIPPLAQIEIDRSPDFIHCPVQIAPPALHPELGLVTPPRTANRPNISVPALLEFRHVALHPTQNRRVYQDNSALSIISARSRALSLYRRYHRTHKTMIS